MPNSNFGLEEPKGCDIGCACSKVGCICSNAPFDSFFRFWGSIIASPRFFPGTLQHIIALNSPESWGRGSCVGLGLEEGRKGRGGTGKEIGR